MDLISIYWMLHKNVREEINREKEREKGERESKERERLIDS